MIIDLNPLPFTLALKIIRWCIEHDVDRIHCTQLVAAMKQKPVPEEIEWVVNVPDKYETWFALAWGEEYATRLRQNV
jgi:hypothetical protein